MLRASLLFVALSVPSTARQAPTTLSSPDWTRPFPPFRIIGNIYWVGTYDLSTYLITTPQGHMGFELADVRILTATHGHFDLATHRRLVLNQSLSTQAHARTFRA